MGAGLILMSAAILLTGYNLWSEKKAEESASLALEPIREAIEQAKKERPEETMAAKENETISEAADEPEVPDYVLDPEIEMPVKEVDGWKYIGILEIPVLDISLPIISEWSYKALKVSPSRYVGSAYTDDLVIAGHNYKSHFGPLKRLSPGDKVYFTDMDGNCFDYEVVLLETLQPTDVEEMKSEEWDLSLFTCTLGGKYRVTVRCQKVNGG